MSTNNWNGSSGDWNTGSNWSGGVPSAGTTASITGAGAYVVTLFGAGSAAGLTLNASGAEFYDAGALTLGGLLGCNQARSLWPMARSMAARWLWKAAHFSLPAGCSTA